MKNWITSLRELLSLQYFKHTLSWSFLFDIEVFRLWKERIRFVQYYNFVCINWIVEKMVQFSSFLSGLTKPKNGKKRRINLGREATEALSKEARKNGLLLTSPGNVSAKWSSNYASAYSKGGNKGINQDSFIVWEVHSFIKLVFFFFPYAINLQIL